MKTIVKVPLNSRRGHLPLFCSSLIRGGAGEVRFPDLADLLARLRFSTSDGRIWLDDQRYAADPRQIQRERCGGR